MTVDELLERARAGLERLDPHEAHAAAQRGGIIVDVRSEVQRAREGVVPGARFYPRNVLEWRLDPCCEARDPEVARYDAHVILMCDEGYQSSLAAANLQALGLERATDMAGGFRAWRAAGLPVDPAP